MNKNAISPVVISDKAYLGIIAETYEKVGTETGGVFLGKYLGDTWYIIEAIDPGPNSIFETAYFEYDTPYVNHLANKVARFYKNGLELVGLWHRHPGSFSSFSTTDSSTNAKYANLCANGAISALVNLDPNFRLSVFHVTTSLKYTKVDYQVGNSYFPVNLLESKNATDFTPSRNVPIRSYEGAPRQPAIDNTNLNSTKKNSYSIFSWFAKKVNRQVSDTSQINIRIQPQQLLTTIPEPSDLSQGAVLDMVESEIAYLESQLDYDFKLKIINENELMVLMEYKQAIAGYPKILKFIFGINHQQGGYVKIDQKAYKYSPGFICNSINQTIGLH